MESRQLLSLSNKVVLLVPQTGYGRKTPVWGIFLTSCVCASLQTDGQCRGAQLIDSRLRIVVVVGTRPEAIKMFPVIQALETSTLVRPYVITTGQHLELCDDVLEMAGITIDRKLHIDRVTGTINELSSQVTANIGEVLEALKLEDPPGEDPITIATMVHGDTTSAMAAGLAAVQAGVPVIHVEAGLRTYNPRGPFPEEINRQVISKLANVQIAPTTHNEANLIRENVSDRHVFVSGNTSIDALIWATKQPVVWTSLEIKDLVAGDSPYIVATLHRRENWERLADIATAFNEITEARPDCKVLLPMHPNPAVQEKIKSALGTNPNVLLVEALGYIEFAHVLAGATLAITDSGGIQEEAPSVQTPVLVARLETEREEGIAAGTLILVGNDPTVIAAQALSLLNHPARLATMQDAVNPFGDGRAAERIKELIEYLVIGGTPPEAFGTGISRLSVLRAAGYQVGSILARDLSPEERIHELTEQTATPSSVVFVGN